MLLKMTEWMLKIWIRTVSFRKQNLLYRKEITGKINSSMRVCVTFVLAVWQLSLVTYMVFAWMETASQSICCSGTRILLLKERDACKASWLDAASPPPPLQFRYTQRPLSVPSIRSTCVIWFRRVFKYTQKVQLFYIYSTNSNSVPRSFFQRPRSWLRIWSSTSGPCRERDTCSAVRMFPRCPFLCNPLPPGRTGYNPEKQGK